MKHLKYRENWKLLVLLGVELALLLWGIAGLFGKSGVVAGREMTAQLLEEGISLPAGAYRVSSFDVTAGETPYRILRHNAVPVFRGLPFQEASFYLWGEAEHLKVVVSGAENLQIQGIEIVATTEGGRVFLFWVAAASLVVNGAAMLILRHKKNPIPMSKLLVYLGIPALAFMASLPVFTDYNLGGEDLALQLARIEAFGRGIGSGNLFLLIPSFLRRLGFTPGCAYQLYLVSVNLATAAASYWAFGKCAGLRYKRKGAADGKGTAMEEGASADVERYMGMFGSMLYVLLPGRLYAIYMKRAVDEYTAMIFLPLLVWGFYGIYAKEDGEKGYLWSFAVPAAGFSCLMQAHFPAALMAAAVCMLLCILLWKKTFRPRRLLALGLMVLTTLALNAGFLVPFLDLMREGRNGAWPGARTAPEIKNLLRSADFAGIAGVCLAAAAVIAGVTALRMRKGAVTGKNVMLLLSAALLLAGSYQLNEILLTENEITRIYAAQSLPLWQTLDGDYFVAGTGLTPSVQYQPPACSEGVELISCVKQGLRVESRVTTGEEGGYIEYPLRYEKGYKACGRETGEALAVERGENGNVRVLFPGNFSGTAKVHFAGMWYWRGAKLISLLAGTAVPAGYLICRSRRQRLRNTRA